MPRSDRGNSALKQSARERAQATGEPYTTALEVVTKDADGAYVYTRGCSSAYSCDCPSRRECDAGPEPCACGATDFGVTGWHCCECGAATRGNPYDECVCPE